MTMEAANFELLVDQRHFYFIALRSTDNYKLTDYWAQVGNIATVKPKKDMVYPNFEIQHRQYRSNFAYPRGKLLKVVSSSKDGAPPYLYDLFAARTNFNNKTYLVLAFPFAALARDIVDKLIGEYNIRNRCDIIKVDLPVLIQHSDIPSDTGQIRTTVVGLQVVISDDPALSSLSLGGDNPMKSSIYKHFLHEPIRQGTTILEQCILACELQQSADNTGEPIISPRKRRARVHIDAFGNFKFYVHIKGENVITIPYLMQYLDSSNCLGSVSINPLHRNEQEEEE